MIIGQHWTRRVPSPSLQRRLRSLVKNVRDVDVFSPHSALAPSSLLVLLLPLLSPAFSLPAGGSHGLYGVGGQRSHVADGVQEVVPCGQANRDLRASSLKTLNSEMKLVLSLHTAAHSVKILFGSNL